MEKGNNTLHRQESQDQLPITKPHQDKAMQLPKLYELMFPTSNVSWMRYVEDSINRYFRERLLEHWACGAGGAGGDRTRGRWLHACCNIYACEQQLPD